MQNLKQQLQNSLNNSSNGETDILPLIRDISRANLFPDNNDLLCTISNNRVPGITAILLEESETTPDHYIKATAEPDRVLVTISLDPENPDLDSLLMYLDAISIWDCTDCCNALSYAILTPESITIYGESIGHIYHS